jgi:hypothetical protein
MKILKENTLFILDWDDTLFPTSWIIRNGISFQQNIKLYIWFDRLDRLLNTLLNKLLSIGNVIIITNAMTVWINMSSQFLPITSRTLKHIRIISARDLYGKITDDNNAWKIMSFKNEIPKIIKNDFANIISIGDADYEYNALINFYSFDKYKSKLLKSIKFIKSPSNEQIVEQLLIVNNAVDEITQSPKHLDLEIKKSEI